MRPGDRAKIMVSPYAAAYLQPGQIVTVERVELGGYSVRHAASPTVKTRFFERRALQPLPSWADFTYRVLELSRAPKEPENV